MYETPSLCISPLKSATLLICFEPHHLSAILKKLQKTCSFCLCGSQAEPSLGNSLLLFAGVTFLQCRLNRQHRSLLTSHWCSPKAGLLFILAFSAFYFFNHTEVKCQPRLSTNKCLSYPWLGAAKYGANIKFKF